VFSIIFSQSLSGVPIDQAASTTSESNLYSLCANLLLRWGHRETLKILTVIFA
jgi:hypothetical protein